MRSRPLRSRRPSASSSVRPALASSTGSAVSEKRIVSPMPSASSVRDAGDPLDQALRHRPGFGDAEVQRMIGRLRQQPVRVDHQRHVRRLHRDLHVVEVDLAEQVELVHRRRDHRLGRDAAVPLGHRGIERTRVHADADRHAARLGLGRDELDVLGLADVARVEAQRLHAGLERAERELVLEVDVGDDRHRRARHDLRERLGRLFLVARAAHDVAAGRGERVDLRERAVDVGGLGRGHRLDRDRRVAADRHRPTITWRVGDEGHAVSLRPRSGPRPTASPNLHRRSRLSAATVRTGSRPDA